MVGVVEWTTFIWIVSLVATVGVGSWSLSWWLSGKLTEIRKDFAHAFTERTTLVDAKLEAQYNLIIQIQLGQANKWAEAAERYASKLGVSEGLNRVVDEIRGLRGDMKGMREELREDLSHVGERVHGLEQRAMEAART